eukprot:TRINITY_DN2568_c0_g1_i7.p1 TRINITY_DN2568_c0_g1~~TRINITY_DN2568_c0_g1_i7.p1  ORF type:complete len:190 (+),score=2.95 TRINITY_DN2568_c0_g1_i7:111-680(+)
MNHVEGHLEEGEDHQGEGVMIGQGLIQGHLIIEEIEIGIGIEDIQEGNIEEDHHLFLAVVEAVVAVEVITKTEKKEDHLYLSKKRGPKADHPTKATATSPLQTIDNFKQFQSLKSFIILNLLYFKRHSIKSGLYLHFNYKQAIFLILHSHNKKIHLFLPIECQLNFHKNANYTYTCSLLQLINHLQSFN